MNRNMLVVLVLATLLATGCAVTTIGQSVQYKDGSTLLEGYLAYPADATGPQPLVLVVHEWWGLNDYAKGRALQLAELGYVAFAVDMYGKGVLATDAAAAGKLAGQFKSDRPAMRRRIAAALDAVRSNPRVDRERVAAIGYCFGGTVVLELARSGADVRGVVSFHGGLDTLSPTDGRNIKAKVLVCTGADDKAVPTSQIAAFEDEFRPTKVDYQIIIYGGAVHAFTNPASGSDPTRNVAYNSAADSRSWRAMRDFLDEIFKR